MKPYKRDIDKESVGFQRFQEEVEEEEQRSLEAYLVQNEKSDISKIIFKQFSLVVIGSLTGAAFGYLVGEYVAEHSKLIEYMPESRRYIIDALSMGICTYFGAMTFSLIEKIRQSKY